MSIALTFEMIGGVVSFGGAGAAGAAGGTGLSATVAPVVAPKIAVPFEATPLPLAKAIAAVPLLALALNLTVATSLLPVTGLIVPRPMATDPPPPVLWASMPKLDDEAMLEKSSRLAGYDKFAWTALTGSVLFTYIPRDTTLPCDTLVLAGEIDNVADAANAWGVASSRLLAVIHNVAVR